MSCFTRRLLEISCIVVVSPKRKKFGTWHTCLLWYGLMFKSFKTAFLLAKCGFQRSRLYSKVRKVSDHQISQSFLKTANGSTRTIFSIQIWQHWYIDYSGSLFQIFVLLAFPKHLWVITEHNLKAMISPSSLTHRRCSPSKTPLFWGWPRSC